MTAATAPRPWRMFAPLGLVLLLLGLWSAYWLVVSRETRRAVEGFERQAAASGTDVACGRRGWGGYPFRVEYGCGAPAVSFAIGGGRGKATSGVLSLVIQPWNFSHVVGLLDGPSALEIPGSPPLTLTHGRAAASLKVAGRTGQVALELPNPEIAGRFSARMITLNGRLRDDGFAEAAAEANGLAVTLPTGKSLSLSRVTALVAAPARLLEAANPLRAAAGAGDALEVKHIDIAGPGYDLGVSGILRVDRAGRLGGQLAVTTATLDGLLAALESEALVSREQLSMVRAAMMLMNVSKASGAVQVNAEFRAGALYLGPFKVADVPPLF